MNMKSNALCLKKKIDFNKVFLTSSDVCRFSDYKFRNAEFRILPPKLNVSLPKLKPRKIKRYHLMEQLGSVSPLFHNRRRILHHGDPFSCILCDRQATVGSSQLLILRHFSDIKQGTGLC